MNPYSRLSRPNNSNQQPFAVRLCNLNVQHEQHDRYSIARDEAGRVLLHRGDWT